MPRERLQAFKLLAMVATGGSVHWGWRCGCAAVAALTGGRAAGTAPCTVSQPVMTPALKLEGMLGARSQGESAADGPS